MFRYLFLITTLTGLNAFAWELPNSEQLEVALMQAFPEFPRTPNPCSEFTSITKLTCKINQTNVEDVECIANVSGSLLTTKDARLIQAFKISEIPFAKQAEIEGINCVRTKIDATSCPNNELTVKCNVTTWGGN